MLRRFLLIPALLIALVAQAAAQERAASAIGADVPFAVGERMTYKVRLGIVGNVGNGSLEVVGIDTIRGRPAYALRFQLKGGIPFAKVEDDFRSWVDTQSLIALRFKQDQKEVKYERHRTIDFFPEERRWRTIDGKETGALTTDQPLDDVSFLYYLRTLPLEVGKTYTFNRYFKEEGNPVTVKVLRKQVVSVPAGKFNTIVVQPIIKTKGLFSEGGQAEIYFTDDDKRILVQLRSKVKILKSLDMHLQSYTPGRRLTSQDGSGLQQNSDSAHRAARQ
jgi:hypothetical protein